MPTRASRRSAVWLVLVGVLAGLNLYQYRKSSAPPPAETRAKGVSVRFHRVFYDAPDTWKANRWLGVSAVQNPNDAWITQEIISEVKPDFVVETGTFHGGSALIWATLLEQVNPTARVITVDIEDHTAEARKVPLFQRKVDFLLGSSTAPEIVSEITRRVQGRKVVVILDSDHHQPHVLRELRAYAPLVPVNSYLIVQDSNVHGHPVRPEVSRGPFEAIQEFLATDKRFEVDRQKERLLLTFNPSGYLKRVRQEDMREGVEE
jgi:cephalosporin hydroxylase